MTTSSQRLQEIDNMILSCFNDVPENERPTKDEVMSALRTGTPIRIKLKYPKHTSALELAVIRVRNLDAKEFLDYIQHHRETISPEN